MEVIPQFVIILLISFLGELLHAVIPLPIPASIYGLVLMLLGLCTGIIKLHQVKKVSAFLIRIMPVMFIPATVGLIVSWADLQSFLVPILLAVTVGTILTMIVTGLTAQACMKKKSKEEADV